MARTSQEPLIHSIHIDGLFGYRSYDVPVPPSHGLDRFVLVHGDNGSGKTTLLRLIWHTLSPSPRRGHRSFIAKTPFRSLTIAMSSGDRIVVEKSDGLQGSFTLTLLRSGQPDLKITYQSSPGHKLRPLGDLDLLDEDDLRMLELSLSEGSYSSKLHQDFLESHGDAREREYLTYVTEHVGTPLFLADDRSLYSDDPDILRMREALNRREVDDRQDRLARLALLELQVTLRRVNERLRGIMIGGQNNGSANSNAIYLEVLRQLVDPGRRDSDVGSAGFEPQVRMLLNRVATVSPEFEKYGLVPRFDAGEFTRLYAQAQARGMSPVVERVMTPFLSSLSARHDALREAQELLNSLVPTVNEFLSGKEVRFTPGHGLQISTFNEEPLGVELLSSGERQLLMLLCTTLLAGLDSRLFIIDEPELSLGVEWQRRIVEALLGLTDGTPLQFLVATHSIEVISSRPGSLVRLVSWK